MKPKKVIVGLSGGVDSSVAAWLLMEQGYEVEGLFMRNWHDTTGLIQSECHWEDDVMFAEMVARKLGIPFHFVDLSEDYRKRVVDYMFSEYEKGRTPNPDILCNREIKFDSFVTEVRKLGGDYLATGHYCRKEEVLINGRAVFRLLAGIDENKDQSYFLCQLSQEQLKDVLFPVGNMTKAEVRETAARLKLPTAHRKDSQGICFIGKVHLPEFLQQKIAPRKGIIVEIPRDAILQEWHTGLPGDDAGDDELRKAVTPYMYKPEMGKAIGEHNGAHYFTIGQRKGINIGGYREPLFVIGIDAVRNILYVGEGQSHPGLYRKGLFIRKDEVHWVRPDLAMAEGESRDYMVRIRYRQGLQKARLYLRKDGMYIVFNKLQRGITPGQFAAWYDGDEVVGSGVIRA
ncbi:MAG TPA: tRNA 2-thiouridine(34) synthase MnmA [Bacteroidales bacterium]|nr:tRNA 2-thiouridine(34) synthase MnmA [Bacteroidales bacterium]HOK74468.1 tRNA 2-thiouridine(34) synthase MnmA [Bacteroidales bacterium]HOM41397.1 tRNA 2-thiouridine(34) synthase MnmA [Bacteroidales bacterium]HPP91981.1 tRNA 2-thiouridine(34) synthase MnmA [Bacteroidales bacterium]HQG56936.1 tRNA 2-thiouridine(34) synthase MnmA [Bacteroidales bacterium]